MAWLPKTKMADCSRNSDEENFDDLEDEDECNDWTEIFIAPENERRGLRNHNDSNISSKERLKMEHNSIAEDSKLIEEDVEKNDSNSTDKSSKTLTRMELNDHKAGMVGLDKEKINQIIFEASKGSRYYENELKKEKQVSERIAKQTACLEKLTQQQRRDALETTNLIVKELEQTRDLSRTFVHIDMDAFYAAVEILDNPELRDKPMAVGSNAMLSTSNYPARRYGVRAAMPGFIAKKLCPELIIVPTHFDKYKDYSRQVQEILAEYDPNFAMASLDEAYLDLTEHLKDRQKCKEKTKFVRSKNQTEAMLGDENDQGTEQAVEEIVEFGYDAQEAVRELRFRIEQKTRLTASAGIASNVMLAKICSDRNKPNGQFFLEPDRDVVLKFVYSLPIRKISGIGRVSEQMLKALGIETCEDLYTKRDLLYLLHSPVSFRFLIEVSLGLGNTSIATDSKRKSIGTETTFSEISKPDELLDVCDKLCQSLAEDMKDQKLKGKTVTIKLKTVNFEVKSRSLSPLNPVSTYEEIFLAAKELLKNEINACLPDPLRLRLMGVRLSNFQETSSDSSKEAKQNTITGFLKQKQSVEIPSSFVPTQQFNTEENSCIIPTGQEASKESDDIVEEASHMADQDSFTASYVSSERPALNLLSTKTSPFSSPGPSSSHAKNCSETLQDKTPKASPALFCPVCGQEQVLKPGDDAMIALNKHIDLCLNKATIREIVSESNSQRSSAGGTVLSRADSRTDFEAASSRGKRKRQQLGTATKKVTLHSFWSK